MKPKTITVNTKENKTYLALGTNIGDREKNLKNALKKLNNIGTVQETSQIYETEPYGPKDQNDYLNLTLKLITELTPNQLLREIKKIEKDMGRIKKEKNHPRIIDIDILLYDSKIIKEKELKIPHPQMHKRKFVLFPLTDIAPNETHPTLKKTIKQLKTTTTDNLNIKKWTKKK